jgi:hypothetical protein
LKKRGKKLWNLKCHFQVNGKEKELRRGWKYTSWNGTCYKEGSEICAFQNVYILSQIFMGLDEIP